MSYILTVEHRSSHRLPDYYRRSITSNRRDRFWNCPADSFLHNLPLVVMYAGYTTWEAGDSYERKESDVFSVELVTAGNAYLLQNGREHVVGPGQAFILHKGGSHRFSTGPAGFLHKRMAVIDGVMLEIVLRSLQIDRHDVVRLDNPSRTAALIRRTNRLMGMLEEGYLWQLSTTAYELLLELGRSILAAEVPREVAAALDYMNRHIGSTLSLQEIAARSGVSMYHFSRLFTRTMNAAPMTFFLRQKMAFARNLLANTNLLVKEIAALLGYDNPAYFTAQFTKNEGVSSQRYRERAPKQWQWPREG